MLPRRTENETVTLTLRAIPFIARDGPTTSLGEASSLVSVIAFRPKVFAGPVAGPTLAIAMDREHADGTVRFKADHCDGPSRELFFTGGPETILWRRGSQHSGLSSLT